MTGSPEVAFGEGEEGMSGLWKCACHEGNERTRRPTPVTTSVGCCLAASRCAGGVASAHFQRPCMPSSPAPHSGASLARPAGRSLESGEPSGLHRPDDRVAHGPADLDVRRAFRRGGQRGRQQDLRAADGPHRAPAPPRPPHPCLRAFTRASVQCRFRCKRSGAPSRMHGFLAGRLYRSAE